ncbi:unnamed protein product [Caenorhabditis nigoni]
MFEDWIYLFLPRIFCVLAFTVNPIFVHLIFTENHGKFGNYRFLLFFFAMFNLMYSVVNVIVPLDIHSFRYCFFVITRHGWFVQRSEFNFHILTFRCSLVTASYAILLVHFIYRYLAIHNSNLTRNKFHWYMIFSILTCALYFGVWHAIVTQLKKVTRGASKKTSKFQVDLLRALVVQTVIPIVISFSPCLFCWLSPMFGIQLPRGLNYLEAGALGVFPFVDPVAIIFSLPVFRKRIFSFCRHPTILFAEGNSSSDRGTH